MAGRKYFIVTGESIVKHRNFRSPVGELAAQLTKNHSNLVLSPSDGSNTRQHRNDVSRRYL
jgi:hypothetical protein